MSERGFFDTNILIYTDDKREPRKRNLCLTLLAHHQKTRSGAISLQVLQEYYAVVTRKMHVDPELARYKVSLFAHMDVMRPDVPDLIAAIDNHCLHKISFWDGLILQAAEAMQCRILYSENFQAKRSYNGIRIVNPFL